jgi:hypothetical protein
MLREKGPEHASLHCHLLYLSYVAGRSPRACDAGAACPYAAARRARPREAAGRPRMGRKAFAGGVGRGPCVG